VVPRGQAARGRLDLRPRHRRDLRLAVSVEDRSPGFNRPSAG
jgi:hypothetical protein